MLVTIGIQKTTAAQLQSSFRISLRVEFDKLHTVTGHECHKRDKVLFCHIVLDGNKMLIFHTLDGQFVLFVEWLCIQCRQCNPTAGNQGIPHRMDDITADGTDIKLGAEHIGRCIFVDNLLAVHQLDERSIQCSCQRLQQRNIWQAFCRFPSRNRFPSHTDTLGQFCLGHPLCFSQSFDGCACNVGIHSVILLVVLASIVTDIGRKRNLRSVDLF